MENSKLKWVKIIIVLILMSLSIWQANKLFSLRDGETGILFSAAAIAFAIAAIAFYFQKKKE